MKLLNGLLLASAVFSLSACCGGGAKKDDRWDTNNPNKPISATATAKPTTAPTTKPTTPTVQPTPTAAPPSGGDKAECKKPGTGALNKAFPEGMEILNGGAVDNVIAFLEGKAENRVV